MPPEQPLCFGAYRLVGPHGPLWRGAQVVPVPPKALAVLWRLASQAGQVVTKEALLDAGWAGTVVSEGALTTCLRTLRQALGEDAQQPRYIATVHRLGYRFVAPVTAGAPVTSPGTPPSPPAPPPLVVGRAAELAQLHAWFAQARQGRRQLVFVTGEAGMGKTTLVEAFLEDVAAAQTAGIGRGQCIEHYGAGEAYLPLLEAMEAVCEGLARQGQFLEERGLAEWPDGTVSGRYVFRHALYQEVLYQRLGSGRRVRCHRAIGARLEAGYGAQASQIAAALAMHFEKGRDPNRAVRYRQQAADMALQRHAYREAMTHLTMALALLATLPDTPARARQELEIQLALGPALLAIKGQGAPEVEQAYRRAHALCQHVEETEPLVPALVGLRMWYFARADLQVAHKLSAHLLNLAQQVQEPALLLEAHRSVGMTWLLQGAFAVARVHLEQGMALSTSHPSRVPLIGQHGPMPGMLPAVACLAYASWVLWALGYADQALQRGHEALALAQTLANPFSVGTAMNTQAVLHLFRGEVQAASQQAEAALILATEHEFAHIAAAGMIRRGGALIGQGRAAEGIGQLVHGLEASRAIGWLIFQPYYLSLLAAAYGHVGQPHEGLWVLAEALAMVDQTGECWWQAELYRLQGELTLQECSVPGATVPVQTRQEANVSPSPPLTPHTQGEAEACFHQALAIARHQQAKALELRAAMNLSRLWQRRGKRAAARELLAPIYGWFTEGFDTADLQEAKALLEELS